MRLVQNKSHSVNRGVADMLEAIAVEISSDIGTPYIDTIDWALRTGKSPVIYQKAHDLSRAMPIACAYLVGRLARVRPYSMAGACARRHRYSSPFRRRTARWSSTRLGLVAPTQAGDAWSAVRSAHRAVRRRMAWAAACRRAVRFSC